MGNRFEERRRKCHVSVGLGSLHYRRCGKPRYAWTNYMEPLCHEHFVQRRFIQNLMVNLSGLGNWGALVVSNDPEMFVHDVRD